MGNPDSGSGSVEVRGAPYWRVAVVEDHRLQRKRTEELVNAQAGLRVVFGCESALELFTRLERLDKREYPHLVILDLVVDRGPSVEPEQVRDLVDRGVRVLVLSALASPTQVRAVIRAGAGGVLGKRDSEADIVTAIWAVLRREHWVTSEMASLVAAALLIGPVAAVIAAVVAIGLGRGGGRAAGQHQHGHRSGQNAFHVGLLCPGSKPSGLRMVLA